jgi:hypothetical protein
MLVVALILPGTLILTGPPDGYEFLFNAFVYKLAFKKLGPLA